VGDPVKEGEVLALVDAPEVGRAKTDYLQAAVQVELKTGMLTSLRQAPGAVAERTVREAEAALEEANIRLRTARQAVGDRRSPVGSQNVAGRGTQALSDEVHFLGLPDDIKKSLDPQATTMGLLPILSPLNGVVVARDVVAGEVVDAAKVLFQVADMKQM